MAPIRWDQYDGEGEFVERFLCTLLHNRYPDDGIHRNPSSGDSGIDFHRRSNGQHEIFQIKSFCAGRFDDTRKRQIVGSYNRAKEENPSLTSWHLITPMNPSREAESWFADLVASDPFPSDWKHRPYCDALAADYPAVARYFVEDRHDEFMRLYEELRTITDGDTLPLTPSDVLDPLQSIASRLDSMSPYYRFYVQTHPGGLEYLNQVLGPAVQSEPLLVVARTVSYSDELAITTRVVARYWQAAEDCPISVQMTVNAEDIESAELAHTPGAPIRFSDVQFTSALPGEEPSTFTGTAELRPSYSQVPGRRRIVALGPDSSEVSGFDLTDGGAGGGVSAQFFKWHDRSGAFTLSINMLNDRSVDRINLHLNLIGLKPHDCRHIARTLLAGFDSRNTLHFQKPADSEPDPGREMSVDLPLEDQIDGWRPALEAIRILSSISVDLDTDYVFVDEFDPQDLTSLREVRNLLDGESVEILLDNLLPLHGVNVEPDEGETVEAGLREELIVDLGQPLHEKLSWLEPAIVVPDVALRLRSISLSFRLTEGENPTQVVSVEAAGDNASAALLHRPGSEGLDD